jgi:hypothetical protein
MINTTSPQTRSLQSPLIAAAWGVTLLVSGMPNILLKELAGMPTEWLLWAKLGLLVALIAASLAWAQIRPLRPFFIIIAALYLLEYASSWAGGTPLWQGWFGGGSGPFRQTMLSNQLLRLAVSLPMVVVLLLVKKKPSAFFLVKGKTDAIAEPIPWLMSSPHSWSRLGWILAACISGGTLTFLVVAGMPSLAVLAQAVPLLPFVVLFAVMNAFSEELNYRAGFLSALEGPVGKYPSLLMTAAFFGIGHFYGVPYGIVGVVLATVLGWFLGKSMLETRGFAWAWFIHFLQDVLIFTFMAIGSVVAGGR